MARGRRLSGSLLLGIAFVIVVALTALAAWLSPRDAASEATLASDGASATGALGVFETLARLGWHPVRRETPLDDVSSRAVYVAVRSDHGADERTAARVVAAVRQGAGLVVDVRPNDPLSDSLHLALAEDLRGPRAVDNVAAAAAVGAAAAVHRPGCRANDATDVGSGTRYVSFALADTGPTGAGNPERHVLLDVAAPGHRAPVVVGFPYGRGRVVAFGDGSVLTNVALRACWAAAGVIAVRAFEWASPAADAPSAQNARPVVVFFEGAHDHLTQAPQPSVVRAVRRALTEVPAGRALTQVLAAALVLLAAAGVRALPPLPSPRAARRSPLEHVGALARAYREARASRVAARRLASGLRRRYGGPFGGPFGGAAGAASADADVRFLDGVVARHPARADDAARLAAALTAPVAPAEVVAVGEAAERIARTLDAARRGLTAPG